MVNKHGVSASAGLWHGAYEIPVQPFGASTCDTIKAFPRALSGGILLCGASGTGVDGTLVDARAPGDIGFDFGLTLRPKSLLGFASTSELQSISRNLIRGVGSRSLVGHLAPKAEEGDEECLRSLKSFSSALLRRTDSADASFDEHADHWRARSASVESRLSLRCWC